MTGSPSETQAVDPAPKNQGSYARTEPPKDREAGSNPSMPAALPNPYVGPRPFEPGETLYGREDEISDLYYLWSAERVVVLCSPSGAGKSSLIHAGLLPRTRGQLDAWGSTRVNQETEIPGANRYVLSALQGFEQAVPKKLRRPAEELAGQTLASYVKNRPSRPGAPKNIALIFDQFEEVLTADPLAIDAKEEFFDQLGELLQNPRVWALFALREDYLAALDPYAHRVPTHLRNRFRMDLLSLEGAREALVEPARLGGRTFPAANQLLTDLATVQVQQPDGSFREQAGYHVEPVQLQVTCFRLWSEMPTDQLSIDAKNLEHFGDVTEALAAFYSDSVDRVATDFADQRAIREWFDDVLITSSGVRSQVLRGSGESGGLDNRLVEGMLDTHLVRAEKRAGATWYELAHDRLIKAVKTDNRDWFIRNLSNVQQRSTLWERQGRPPGLLMQDEELEQGLSWAERHPSQLTEVERLYLEASQEAQRLMDRDRRQRQRIQRLAFVATAVGIVAALAFIVAFFFLYKATIEKGHAEESLRASTSQGFLASSPTRARLVALESREPDETSNILTVLYTTLASSQRWVVLSGHAGVVKTASFSPDGLRAVTGSADNSARIWNAETGHLEHELEGHEDSVIQAVFSPHGKQVLTTSLDGAVRFWDASTGLLLKSWGGGSQGADIRNAFFRKDRAWALGLPQPGLLSAWELDPYDSGAPNERWRLELEGQTLNLLAPHLESSRLVTQTPDEPAVLRDLDTGQAIAQLDSGPHVSVSFSPDGTRLATFASASGRISCGEDLSDLMESAPSTGSSIKIWDAHTGQPIPESPQHQNVLHAVFADAQRLILASCDRIHAVELGGEGESYEFGTPGPITLLSVDSDGSKLFVGEADSGFLWDLGSKRKIASYLGHTNRMEEATFNAHGSRVITASRDDTARIWRAGNSGDLPGRASFSTEGNRVLFTSESSIRVWDLEHREEILGLEDAGIGVTTTNSDGTQIAGQYRGGARLWGLEDGQAWDLVPGTEGIPGTEEASPSTGDSSAGDPNISLLFHPEDPNLLATLLREPSDLQGSTRPATAILWDVSKRQPLHEHDVGLDAKSLSFSGDGSRWMVLSAGIDGESPQAHIWDTRSGVKAPPLQGLERPRVGSLDPEGSQIAIASSDPISNDHVVELWDVDTGKSLIRLEEHTSWINALVFSPDGSKLVTTSEDGSARLWDPATGESFVLNDHRGVVLGAAFNTKGSQLLTTSSDRSAILWELPAGDRPKKRARLKGHRHPVQTASFSQDNQWILTSSKDGTSRLWPNHTELLLGMNRAGTYSCLDKEFREENLNENADRASKREAACRHCVSIFFKTLDSRTDANSYLAAWHHYQTCLEDRGW